MEKEYKKLLPLDTGLLLQKNPVFGGYFCDNG
jgi:hypothetical protein